VVACRKVGKALEIRIDEIAAAMDEVERNGPKEFHLILHGQFGDPMAKELAPQLQSPSPRSVAKQPAANAVPDPAAERSFRDKVTGEEFVEMDIGDGPEEPVYDWPRPRRPKRGWLTR